MFNAKLERCPGCGDEMQKGFSGRNAGLSWIEPEKFQHFAFGDKDLNERGLKKLLPVNKAAYDLSYHCPGCKLYIVDYSRSYSRAEANELAASLLAKADNA